MVQTREIDALLKEWPEDIGPLQFAMENHQLITSSVANKKAFLNETFKKRCIIEQHPLTSDQYDELGIQDVTGAKTVPDVLEILHQNILNFDQKILFWRLPENGIMADIVKFSQNFRGKTYQNVPATQKTAEIRDRLLRLEYLLNRHDTFSFHDGNKLASFPFNAKKRLVKDNPSGGSAEFPHLDPGGYAFVFTFKGQGTVLFPEGQMDNVPGFRHLLPLQCGPIKGYFPTVPSLSVLLGSTPHAAPKQKKGRVTSSTFLNANIRVHKMAAERVRDRFLEELQKAFEKHGLPIPTPKERIDYLDDVRRDRDDPISAKYADLLVKIENIQQKDLRLATPESEYAND